MSSEAITRTDGPETLKETIHTLYTTLLLTHAPPTPQTTRALTSELKRLPAQLHSLQHPPQSHTSHDGPDHSGLPGVPPEILDYVSSGRNPDIYTREFVEVVQESNMHLKGRAEAFARFRDVFAREIVGAVPGMEGVVGRVVGSGEDADGGGGGDGGGR